jgi:thiamine pyrophosphate-dependent acetolactate synthase large subunit-like protein
MSTVPDPSLQPDQPTESPTAPVDQRIGWGSDVAAQMLRRLDIPFIALTPGASYRGLHDSLVNHLGNETPKMLLCLHEEHAVAIAHGYAKASGRAMAVALHSNVGLMHGSMAIFNAWCDRQPMLIVGATGPLDAAQRRPWIDWVHTAQDQGALIRHFVKWDDQPGSVEAMPESFLRAWQIAATPPCGPVYVCLDATLQERALDGDPTFPDPARFRPPAPAVADTPSVDTAAKLLAGAERSLILFGRGARTPEGWQCRVALAERLGAAMLSDLKAGSMVPSHHPQHVGPPFNRPSRTARKAIGEADVILSLGWIDLGGLLNQAFDKVPPTAKIIHADQDTHLHGGWGKEHGVLPPVDVRLLGDPDRAAAALLSRLADTPPKAPWFAAIDNDEAGAETGDRPTMRDLALALAAAAGDQPITYAALPRGWPVALAPHRDPLAYLGKDGGGGVGSGPGLTIGAALALRRSGRLAVGILGDGDCMMSINALWTAARYEIPVLFIVANNRSYYNDEVHQENVARGRSRNMDNKRIGIAIDQPAPDFARLAEAQGVAAVGPVTSRDMLPEALSLAVDSVRRGKPFLVDVRI